MDIDTSMLLLMVNERHEQLKDKKQEILDRIAALELEGVEYGTPSYKAGKYLRIVKGGRGQQREFVYVGSDPEKIEVALAAIERGRQVLDLKVNLERVEHDEKEFRWYLSRSLR